MLAGFATGWLDAPRKRRLFSAHARSQASSWALAGEIALQRRSSTVSGSGSELDEAATTGRLSFRLTSKAVAASASAARAPAAVRSKRDVSFGRIGQLWNMVTVLGW